MSPTRPAAGKAGPPTPGSVLAARQTELDETVALVAAAKPTSPEHERFLSYLGTITRILQEIYDAGTGDCDLAEMFRQGLRAFVPLVDEDWLKLRPAGRVVLDDEDRALLRLVRRQRRVFKSRKPPTEDGAILATLLIMTLEAIEIYIITRYDDGRKACMELWFAMARALGHDVDSL